MKNLHIKDSYKHWCPNYMHSRILEECFYTYDSLDPEEILHRSFDSMYAEWWFHNIGYWLTLPFLWCGRRIKEINLRCKDVDLNEYLQY